VQLGEKLRIRGQGLDAGLRGDLRLSAPQGRLRVDGSVRTVDGTYRAYRQRLNIERGVLTFNGPVENPQLDIEAIRPNLDVRVGVAVTGTVLVPRVRLFSEPDMSDADKLSWLLRGRASEGPGSGDTALLQAAAMALISATSRACSTSCSTSSAWTTCRCGRATAPPEAPSSRSASSCRATGTSATNAG
jgi:translocation and assembly module TamB